MARERRYGMDNDHYEWSPIVRRKPLVWPGGARVAFCVIVNLEQLDWRSPPGSYQPPLLYSHLAPIHRPAPELWTISVREYGHRVGVFRLFDLLDKHGIRSLTAQMRDERRSAETTPRRRATDPTPRRRDDDESEFAASAGES